MKVVQDYEAPKLEVVGSLVELTLDPGSPTGDDPD